MGKRVGESRGSYKFDARARKRYLRELAATGRRAHAAKAAGVCCQTVKDYRDQHEEFEAEVDEAMNQYRDDVAAEVHRRGLLGVRREIYYKGEVVGHELVFSDRMLELEAKRHIPEYRDKQQVDMNVGGGVMVVPGMNPNWEEEYGGEE